MRSTRLLSLALLLSSLAACGGGGEDAPAPTPTPPAPEVKTGAMDWGGGTISITKAGSNTRKLGSTTVAGSTVQTTQFTVKLEVSGMLVNPSQADCQLTWVATVEGHPIDSGVANGQPVTFKVNQGTVLALTTNVSLNATTAAVCGWADAKISYSLVPV